MEIICTNTVTLIFLLEKYENHKNAIAKNISVLNNVAGIYNVQVNLILTLSVGSIEDHVITHKCNHVIMRLFTLEQ